MLNTEVGRFNAYSLVVRAVEEGVEMGWRRAHKHTETPDQRGIREEIVHEVLVALQEIMDFPPYVEQESL